MPKFSKPARKRRIFVRKRGRNHPGGQSTANRGRSSANRGKIKFIGSGGQPSALNLPDIVGRIMSALSGGRGRSE